MFYHNSIEKEKQNNPRYTEQRESSSACENIGEDEVRMSTLSNVGRRVEQYTFPLIQNLTLDKIASSRREMPNLFENKENLHDNEYIAPAKGTMKSNNLKSSKLYYDPKYEYHDHLGSDSTHLECEETMHMPHSMNRSTHHNTYGPNASNTTILISNLNLNCEESTLEGHPYYEKKGHSNFSFWRYDDSDVGSTPITKKLSIQDEIKLWEQNLSVNLLAADVLENMIQADAEYSVDPHYFTNKQKDINWIMRGILIDWMMEVSAEFQLKRDTLYQAVNFVDRYLSTVPNVPKWELQLVGVTALFVACKMEVEICHYIY